LMKGRLGRKYLLLLDGDLLFFPSELLRYHPELYPLLIQTFDQNIKKPL